MEVDTTSRDHHLDGSSKLKQNGEPTPTDKKDGPRPSVGDMTSADYYFDSYAHFGKNNSCTLYVWIVILIANLPKTLIKVLKPFIFSLSLSFSSWHVYVYLHSFLLRSTGIVVLKEYTRYVEFARGLFSYILYFSYRKLCRS